LTGSYESALKDAEKDLHFKHDGSAYVMAGIISYKLEARYYFLIVKILTSNLVNN